MLRLGFAAVVVPEAAYAGVECWSMRAKQKQKQKNPRDPAAQVAVGVQPELRVQRLMLCVQDKG